MPELSQPNEWETLFRQQVPDVLRLAIRLVGNTHDAEDIVQEALLRAARSRESFRGECSLRTWMSRIVVNVFRTWLAQQKPTEMLNHDPVATSSSHEANLNRAERAEMVAQHVSRLPERQREVLVLCVYENMSASDVAEMLGLTVQNVYSNLSAAKRQLKESLAALLKNGADT